MADCDYYIVIIKRRYGAIGPGGKSFTEMEFDYASQIGLPILAFLYDHSIPVGMQSSRRSACITLLRSSRRSSYVELTKT